MKTFVVLCVLLLATVWSFAQDSTGTAAKPESKEITYHGILLDAMCGKPMAGKADAMTKAADHTKSCALEESCKSSGYGVLSDGTYHKFDDNGDKEALDLLNKSTKTKALAVVVKGTESGDVFTVTSIKEAKSKMSGKKSRKKST